MARRADVVDRDHDLLEIGRVEESAYRDQLLYSTRRASNGQPMRRGAGEGSSWTFLPYRSFAVVIYLLS